LSILILLLLAAGSPPALAQVQYRAGPLLYTPAYDFTTGYTPNGTGYYIAQAYIPSPPQPTVSQPYYVSVIMSGIASPAVGRLMAVHFVPPAGTAVVVDAAIPLRCFYRAMDASGQYVEFTNQVITDNSFGANLRISGCPQPAAGGNPFQIVQLPGGNGSAYWLDRRDPLRPGQPSWPLGSQASYEFQVPLVSSRTMDGFSNADRFYGAVQSVQGDGLDPWVYPYLSLLVSPASGGAVADMGAGPQTPPAPPPPNRAGIQVRCTNNGPSVAQNASCGFTNIPSGLNASVVCSPTSPQATLAVNASIICAVIMDRFIGSLNVTGITSASTADSNLTNNSRTFTVSGGLFDAVYASGFE
jgi:hypothetical protein